MKAFLSLSFALSFSFVMAQPGSGDQSYPAQERIEQAKIAFLTRRLDLSPKEGQQFWPIYNELEEKLHPLREKRLQLMHPGSAVAGQPSDARIRARVMAELDLREKQAQLRKTYFPRFEAAIGTEKAARYYRAEIEFNLHLMRRLQKLRDQP